MSVHEDFNNFYIQYNSPDVLSEPNKAHKSVENVSNFGDKIQEGTGHAEKDDQPDLRWPDKLDWSKYRCHESQNHGSQTMFCDSMGFSKVDRAGLFFRKFISVQ